jgi:hypothetical protein
MPPEAEPVSSETAGGGEIKGRLVSIGAGAHADYPIDKPILKIGSHSSNDIVLTDTTVSRYHATISRRRGRFVLTDLGSTNGTTLNGKRVSGAVTLKRGDEVRFGAVRLGFIAAGDTVARARPSLTGFGIMLAAMLAIGFFAARYFLGPHPIHTATQAIDKSLGEKRTTEVANQASTVAPAAPSAVATTPPPQGPQPPWLARLNQYREAAKLPAVGEDDGLSSGDKKHVAYLVTNYSSQIVRGNLPGLEMHQESSGKPDYSAEGLNAAQHSDVDFLWWKGKTPETETWAVDDWITGPFHRLPLLSPRLESVGYAQDCHNQLCVGAMNAQSDIEAGGAGFYKSPIVFPPEGTVLSLKWFTAEVPNPLTSCANYTKPTGIPITLQLGNFVAIKMDSYSLRQVDPAGDSVEVDACGFDSSTYTNPDPAMQAAARETLNAFGAVVVVPREPLLAGAEYKASITVNGHPYDWHFSAAP